MTALPRTPVLTLGASTSNAFGALPNLKYNDTTHIDEEIQWLVESQKKGMSIYNLST